jgi:hypothetical protein
MEQWHSREVIQVLSDGGLWAREKTSDLRRGLRCGLMSQNYSHKSMLG